MSYIDWNFLRLMSESINKTADAFRELTMATEKAYPWMYTIGTKLVDVKKFRRKMKYFRRYERLGMKRRKNGRK